MDIFYNDLRNQLHGLFQNRDGRFFEYVSYRTQVAKLSRRFTGWGSGFIDFDNDGWKDIYSANGGLEYLSPDTAQHDTMLRNLDGIDLCRRLREPGPGFHAYRLPARLFIRGSQR